MKLVYLEANAIGKDVDLSGYGEFGEVVVRPDTGKDELIEALKDAEIAIVNKCRITEEVLAAAPKLQYIGECATGFDNIDLEACRRHGVAVTNVSGYSTDSVAQWTLTTALALASRLIEYREFTHDGRYTAAGSFTRVSPAFFELKGKTWGVLGAGNIGGQVAHLAQAFGCRVIVYRRKPDPEFETVSAQELFRRSDIISMHLPLNEETHHIVNEAAIAEMKDGAILVNAGRGPLVDGAAVLAAMKAGKLGGVGLDVFDGGEPFAADSVYPELGTLPNVILTPHMAWGTFEARTRLIRETQENIRAYLAGERRNRLD